MVRSVGTKLQYNSSGTIWTDISGSYADIEWSAANFVVNGAALLLVNPTNGGYYWNGSSNSNTSNAQGKIHHHRQSEGVCSQ
ncbi:hypothetical protein ABER23_17325 [Paenibacillus lautus]|uniref:hypothetical protein n=1 Tax=Paenibacillus lautus TaxID=1401 RepID=UPI003D2D491A